MGRLCGRLPPVACQTGCTSTPLAATQFVTAGRLLADAAVDARGSECFPVLLFACRQRQERAKKKREEAAEAAWRQLLRAMLARVRLQQSYDAGGAGPGAGGIMAEAAADLLRANQVQRGAAGAAGRAASAAPQRPESMVDLTLDDSDGEQGQPDAAAPVPKPGSGTRRGKSSERAANGGAPAEAGRRQQQRQQQEQQQQEQQQQHLIHSDLEMEEI